MVLNRPTKLAGLKTNDQLYDDFQYKILFGCIQNRKREVIDGQWCNGIKMADSTTGNHISLQ